MHGAANAFDFQHGFGEVPHGSVGHFGGKQLGEAAFHFVRTGVSGVAEAEELAVAAADDRQELLFLAAVRFTHQDDPGVGSVRA